MTCAEFQNLGAHARRQPWEASNFYDILGAPQDVNPHSAPCSDEIDQACARLAVNIVTISTKMNKYTSPNPTCWSKDPAVRKRFDEIVQAYAALRIGTATDHLDNTDPNPYAVLGVARNAQSSDIDVACKICLLSIRNKGRIPEADIFRYARLYYHDDVMEEKFPFSVMDDVVAFEKLEAARFLLAGGCDALRAMYDADLRCDPHPSAQLRATQRAMYYYRGESFPQRAKARFGQPL
jgi:hypothetical protein